MDTDQDDTPFRPDWVSAPGETIATILEERGWSKKRLAAMLWLSIYDIEDLLSGKKLIDEELAEQLGKKLGPNAEFWMEREAVYRAGPPRKTGDHDASNYPE